MKPTLSAAVCAAFFVAAGQSVVLAADGGLGLRAGLGTDVTGGLAYGVNVNKLVKEKLEIGAYFFRAHSEETTEEFHTYTETTDVSVFAVLGNLLYGYSPAGGFYYLAGAGLGVFRVEWEEKSPTDVTLGTRLAGGGSKQSAEGTAAGTVLNLGLGYRFGKNFDLRAELPLFFIFDAPGDAASVIPTLTATVGYRF